MFREIRKSLQDKEIILFSPEKDTETASRSPSDDMKDAPGPMNAIAGRFVKSQKWPFANPYGIRNYKTGFSCFWG
jgi:hypothetical protein